MNALAVDREASLPVILYDYPDRMGIAVGEDFLNHVSRLGVNAIIRYKTWRASRER